MKYDRQLEKEFFEYLESIGYPKGAIIYQPAVHPVRSMKCYRPSFALIDPEKNEYLAIVEVKEAEIGAGSIIYRNMKDYGKALGNEPISVYIVSTSQGDESPFVLHTFDDKGEISAIDYRLFPSFEAMSAKESADRKADLRAERINVVDGFRNVCWFTSAVLFILVAVDFFLKEYCQIDLLTAERISLLGGALALIVLPFAQKFKGLGIEWEKIENADGVKKK